MKNFKDLMLECSETVIEVEEIIDEGKVKVKKVVKDASGKFKKKITYTCTGDNEKFSTSKGKCVHISGSEKMNKKKGAKKRAKTLKKKPEARKEKERNKRAKANARFGL